MWILSFDFLGNFKEEMIMELLKFVLSDFYVFIGFCILLYLVLKFLFKSWNRLMRHFNIRKHGYPPEHCDADGDFKFSEE